MTVCHNFGFNQWIKKNDDLKWSQLLSPKSTNKKKTWIPIARGRRSQALVIFTFWSTFQADNCTFEPAILIITNWLEEMISINDPQTFLDWIYIIYNNICVGRTLYVCMYVCLCIQIKKSSQPIWKILFFLGR